MAHLTGDTRMLPLPPPEGMPDFPPPPSGPLEISPASSQNNRNEPAWVLNPDYS